MKKLDKEQLEAVKSFFNISSDMMVTHLKEKGLIEPELVIGKWYHYGKDLLVWNGGDLTYGFIQGVDYLNGAYFTVDDATPATDKEVSDALIKEAKRQGFKEGAKVSCLSKLHNFRFKVGDVIAGSDYDYWFETNKLWMGSCLIFSNGKWAEIIEDESYGHTLTYGTSNTYPDNEITVNGVTYVKK